MGICFIQIVSVFFLKPKGLGEFLKPKGLTCASLLFEGVEKKSIQLLASSRRDLD